MFSPWCAGEGSGQLVLIRMAAGRQQRDQDGEFVSRAWVRTPKLEINTSMWIGAAHLHYTLTPSHVHTFIPEHTTCTHLHTPAHILTSSHVHTHLYLNTHLYTSAHILIPAYVHTHLYLNTHNYTPAHTCTHTPTYPTHLYIHTLAYTCLHTTHSQLCTHTHLYTLTPAHTHSHLHICTHTYT